MQGGLIRQLVKRWREQSIMLAGLLFLAVGLISLGLVSIGDGAVSPIISTLLSFVSPLEAQGEMLRLAQGFASLGRIIGPIAAGELDTLSNPGLPLISGGILVILAVVIILPILPAIRQPEARSEEEIRDERQWRENADVKSV